MNDQAKDAFYAIQGCFSHDVLLKTREPKKL